MINISRSISYLKPREISIKIDHFLGHGTLKKLNFHCLIIKIVKVRAY
jgi:hypothetical protein